MIRFHAFLVSKSPDRTDLQADPATVVFFKVGETFLIVKLSFYNSSPMHSVFRNRITRTCFYTSSTVVAIFGHIQVNRIIGVDIRVYDIIYKLIEDVQKALTGLLEPVYEDVVTGHAEVRAVFRISKVGKIAGCYVTDGEITRSSSMRVRRKGEVLADDRIGALKRFHEDVTEVKTGFECGIDLNNFTDFQEGDIIEAYKRQRVR